MRKKANVGPVTIVWIFVRYFDIWLWILKSGCKGESKSTSFPFYPCFSARRAHHIFVSLPTFNSFRPRSPWSKPKLLGAKNADQRVVRLLLPTALFLPFPWNHCSHVLIKIIVSNKEILSFTCAVFLCLFLISLPNSFEGIPSSFGMKMSGALLFVV